MSINDLLKAPIAECVEQNGAHLIDLLLRGEKGGLAIEVFIDNEKGVTSELCSDISRTLVDAIDGSGLVNGAYRLEVSSPGIDRPLSQPWQFTKHLGRTVEVLLKDGTTTLSRGGLLVSSSGGSIVLGKQGSQPDITIPVQQIIEIRVKAPW